MDQTTMRKRGWSVHSEATANSQATEQSEDLDVEQKKALLDSFPSESLQDELLAESHKQGDTDKDLSDDLWGGDASPAKKKRKVGEPAEAETTIPKDQLLEHAKGKLSKWAARLFDPNRPRGLVEPPMTIPLNDELLQAFGKREKEFDVSLGRQLDVDATNLDEQDAEDKVETKEEAALLEEQDFGAVEGRKVKIANLAYTTNKATLFQACEVFGPIVECNLIMQEETLDGPRPLNMGRAYVTFETTTAAEACLEKLTKLEGRPLRLAMAIERTTRKSMGGGGGAKARYWEIDISTKCFRCGQVGHMEAQCPNEAKPRPCQLCGQTGHEFRECPISRVCFRCGVPGHINRDCKYRENLPRRMVCGICFQSGHHRVTCRSRPMDAPSQDGKCLVCHQLGHFMCSEMKWFFGLDGITCFNCGRSGHHGYDCDRPNLDQCNREPELGAKEIERAEAFSSSDELEKQRNKGRGRERGRNDNRRDTRAKSVPPPRGYQHDGGSGNRMYVPSNQPRDHGRGYGAPPSDPRPGSRGGVRHDQRGYGSPARGRDRGGRGGGGNRRRYH